MAKNIITANWKTIFQGLPMIWAIILTVVGIIIFIVQLDSRVGYIQKDHVIFGDQYRREIDEIKAGIIRIEAKIDKLK